MKELLANCPWCAKALEPKIAANHVRWCTLNPKRETYVAQRRARKPASIETRKKRSQLIKAAWARGAYVPKPRHTDAELLATKKLYWEACKFRFPLQSYPEEFDLQALTDVGMYSPTNKGGDGRSGFARDHQISVHWGFAHQVDPKLIRHPANCALILQQHNNLKKRRCSITLEELKERIAAWDEKYLTH